MKKLFIIPTTFIAILLVILSACKKHDVIDNGRSNDRNNTNNTNKSPIANAGTDQVTFSPQDTAVLDGTGSYDPDGSIIKWQWTIVFGPHSGLIKDSSAAKTSVCDLIRGLYKFQLTVTDNAGATATDVVQVLVDELPGPPCDAVSRPLVKLTFKEIGHLSVPRIPTIAAAGNTIVFAGGGYQYSLDGYTEPTLAVDIYNTERGDWGTAQLSVARQNMATVSCGNKIFFAGGDKRETVYDNVDVYDAASNSWTLMHLSQPRTAITAKALGTKVFFAGGTRDGVEGISTVDIYDLPTNTWTTAQLSVPVFNVSAVVDGNRIYFFKLCLEDMGYLFDFYDLATGAWSSSELRGMFEGIFDANINGSTYWTYWGDSGSSAYLAIANKSTGDSVSSCLSHYPQGCLTKNNEIVFLNGYRSNGISFINQLDIYNPQTHNWSAAVLPGAEVKPVSVNNTLYVGGGFNYEKGIFTDRVYAVNW